jgi:DNA-binding NtrC family response regulator
VASQANRERILVASEDIALVNRLDWLLTEAGYAVVIAASMTAARAALSSNVTFSLLLVDIRLPDGAQLDLVMGGVPVIVVGGCASPQVRTFVEAHGGMVIDEPIEAALRSKLDEIVVH